MASVILNSADVCVMKDLHLRAAQNTCVQTTVVVMASVTKLLVSVNATTRSRVKTANKRNAPKIALVMAPVTSPLVSALAHLICTLARHVTNSSVLE